MSKVFRVASSEHTNEASFAMSQLDDNIDRGCFGIAINKPELGQHADPSKMVVQISTSFFFFFSKKLYLEYNIRINDLINIERDPMSHVQKYKSLELYQVNLDTRVPQLVQESWSGSESANGMFNYKDTVKNKTSESNVAYYYK